jgi:L-ascorbate metabolism protein UlaG (beta-lactamase superfamily)
MKVTKYGHACLILDHGEQRLIIDPGAYTRLPVDLGRVRTIIVSEEHPDHFNIDNLKRIMAQSPEAKVYTTKVVAEQLTKGGVPCEGVEGESLVDADGFKVKLREGAHAPVNGHSPCRVLTVQVGQFLYYPSDSFIPIGDMVQILATPTYGPWYNLDDALKFLQAVRSEVVFATHNTPNSEVSPMDTHRFLEALAGSGREWVRLATGESRDF